MKLLVSVSAPSKNKVNPIVLKMIAGVNEIKEGLVSLGNRIGKQSFEIKVHNKRFRNPEEIYPTISVGNDKKLVLSASLDYPKLNRPTGRLPDNLVFVDIDPKSKTVYKFISIASRLKYSSIVTGTTFHLLAGGLDEEALNALSKAKVVYYNGKIVGTDNTAV